MALVALRETVNRSLLLEKLHRSSPVPTASDHVVRTNDQRGAINRQKQLIPRYSEILNETWQSITTRIVQSIGTIKRVIASTTLLSLCG